VSVVLLGDRRLLTWIFSLERVTPNQLGKMNPHTFNQTHSLN